MGLSRFVPAGATFVWPHDNQPLQEARDLHVPTGVLQPGVGPWGPYLTFDGATTFITLGASWEDQLRFDAGTLDFSIVAWIRHTVTGAIQSVFCKCDGAFDGWALFVDAADDAGFILDAITTTGPVAITDGLWHCVIATVDRDGDILVYVDGIPGAGVAVGGEVMDTTTAPTIGAVTYDASARFAGDIAGMFIIPRILTPAECLGLATGRAF